MKFLEAFAAALPNEICLDDLKALVAHEQWLRNPEEAAIHCLRLCGKFDARDYLERYPDVAREGMDPIRHFVERGIYEGKRFRCLPDIRFGHSKVRFARDYFRRGDYVSALYLYEELADQMGERCFSANMALCRKRLGDNFQKKSISIIIPAYNAEKTLPRALDSILNQTLPDWEIIIYDDCSTDRTVDVVREYQRRADIRLLESPTHTGQGRGRNLALQYAQGRFVTFLDADDYYQDNAFLEHLLAQAVAERADIVVTPYVRKKGGKFAHDRLHTGIMSGREAARKFLSREFGTHAPGGKLFRSHIARNCAFVEYGYSQDVLFCFNAFRMAQRVSVSARHGYVYENDTISSWRPVQLTGLHFFSSLRLLTEIWAEVWADDDRDFFAGALGDFMTIWRAEHGPRLTTYLAEHDDEEDTRRITSAFDGLGALLLQALGRPCPSLYGPVPSSSDACGSVPPAALDYARARTDAAVKAFRHVGRESGFTHDRELLVIYLTHLSSGGLERVAAQWSAALAAQYDILYLLDAPDQVAYSHAGRVMKADLFDPVVRCALDQAAFIVDFKYKQEGGEYPLCLYCLDHYAFKYIATVHNTETCGKYVQKLRDYLGSRDWDALYAVLCVSEAVKNVFIQRYGPCAKAEVVPNPVDFEAIKAAPEIDEKGERPFVLFAGRMNATRQKGLDILLAAWARSSIRTGCRLVLAGGGKPDAAIQELLTSDALADSVETTGFQENIYGLMKKALFVVAPSRWEGFSMTLIESLACGTPVLATRVGGAEEVIRDGVNGLLIPSEDVEATVRGLEYLFAHAEEMEGDCRQSVRELSLPHYRQRLLRLLYDPRRKRDFPKSDAGHFRYTIVSACYNAELYLDDFFQSITAQSLRFETHIQCIMVDDGSTDNTADVIRRWQARYPDNIRYFHQENAGQGSARNLGLRHVQTPWVTFTDPDDFLDIDYFKNVDDFLYQAGDDVCMVAAKIIKYHEDKEEYREDHPLNFKFRDKINVCNVRDMGKNIQLHVASAFLKFEFINYGKLCFDINIKPNFEDAHFVINYLMLFSDKKIAFMRDVVYFYRKRENQTSTLDITPRDKRYYKNPLAYGCLDLIKKNRDLSLESVYNSTLYHIVWYIKSIINHPEKCEILTVQEQNNFLNLLDECFSHIDDKIIMRFNFAGIWFYHKVGMLSCFKNKTVPKWYGQIAYIEDYDAFKDEVLVRYFTDKLDEEAFQIDGEAITPSHTKIQRDDFLGRTFVLTRYLWLPLGSKKGVFRAAINNQPTMITLAKRQHRGGVATDTIRQAFQEKIAESKKAAGAPWIFMDREIQADDNAEHLYRYVMRHYPEQEIYFVLRRDSHDWERLHKEGFRLLAYGSKAHKAMLLACSKIISSHIDYYITNYFEDNSLSSKQFIWLQHGVTGNDLSDWLNKKRMSLFITTTQEETDSILKNYSHYKFTAKEVKLCGFPRHDALLDARHAGKSILVMPTWRHHLMGEQIAYGNLRKKNPQFMQSDYARAWSDFLNAPELEKLSETYKREIVFFPHANIQPYLDEFTLPEYVHILKHNDGSIQKIFAQAALMVTDYSSVAFEMAYLCRPIIYYQFDEKEFFSNHTLTKGYFDYRTHGFGPVVTEQKELLSALERLLADECTPEQVYRERMESTFAFRDGRNCERVYHAIQELDKK